MEEKVCSFFGHRKIADSVALRQRIESEIVNLIENYGVNVFLFGSRSDFDSLCHAIVTELKEKYPHIQRRAYTCRSETCTLEKERAYWEGIYSYFEKRLVTLLGVEEEVEHKNKYTAGKAQYVERNQAMINDSDFCVFYYNPYYQPPRRKYSKRSVGDYQPKSGTQLAFDYANQRKRGGKDLRIFDYAVSHRLDVKYGKSVINKYIDLVKSCCHYDCHETPIIDFMNYMANYWDCLCDLENYSEVLDRFYENRSER